MSARLLRGEMARHKDGHGGSSRQGFYARASTRFYTRALRLVDAPPRRSSRSSALLVVAVVASRSTAWSSRSTCPTDVDEAEFEVSVTAPAGHQPRRDGRGDAPRSRREHARDPGRAHRAGDRRAAASSAPSTRRRSTCASRRTRSACSRSVALLTGAVHGCSRWRAFEGNYTQRDVMGRVRQLIRKLSGPARLGAQRAVVQHRRRQLRDRLRRSAGPSWRTLARYTETLRADGAGARHRRRRHDAEARHARAARAASTASAPPTSACDTAGHRHGAAPDGRRRRRGLALPRRRGQRGLRRAAAPHRRRPQRRRDDRPRCYVPRTRRARWSASTTWSRSSRPTSPSRIDRLDRQRDAQRARAAWRPGYALADRLEASAPAAARA